MAELKCKVVLLGEPAVGKTSLIRRYVEGQFDEKYISTVGTANSKKSLRFDNKSLDMIIWDLMGQHITDTLLKTYLRGADGALLVGDLTKPKTLRFSDYWGPKLYEVAGKVPIVLLGNKCDLVGDTRDTNRYLNYLVYQKKLLERQFNVVGTYLTSAKTGENVESAFSKLGEALVQNV
ncbi:MAG: Rab family GTPase [Candidatus Nanoarchaeia archaeon]